MLMTISELGNIPVDFSILRSLYPDIISIHNKVSELFWLNLSFYFFDMNNISTFV